MLYLFPIVYNVQGGLGDMWANICWLIKKSMLENIEINITNNDVLIEEILNIFYKNYDFNIKLVNQQYSKKICMIGCEYLKTNVQWENDKTNLVTYQFDGRSHGYYKNLTSQEENLILQYLSKNYFLVNIGKNQPLQWCIEMLSQARFHIGIDSGMSHVSQSVGIPTNIIYKHMNIDLIIRDVYPNKSVSLFYTVQHFIDAIKLGFNPQNKDFYIDNQSYKDSKDGINYDWQKI